MKARETLFTNFEQNLQFYVVKDTATTWVIQKESNGVELNHNPKCVLVKWDADPFAH
jgi:hypothetical protein